MFIYHFTRRDILESDDLDPYRDGFKFHNDFMY